MERSSDANAKFWEKAAEGPAWYVVEAIEGGEFALALVLSLYLAEGLLHGELFHPVDVRRKTKRVRVGGVETRHEVIRKESRFGPLMFARLTLTEGVMASIEHLAPARGIVCARDSRRPIVISDQMIDFYRIGAVCGAVNDVAKYQAGDVVRVASGPCVGQLGKVYRVDSSRSLRLDTSSFGGTAPLIIEAVHVELVERWRGRPIKPDIPAHSLPQRA